jgi:hypothetical protein
MFEHLIHKKYGFEEAKNRTLILSKAALAGECAHLQVSRSKEYLALIPFYGGLPPGVTKDLTVKSIGQGNSLVSGDSCVCFCPVGVLTLCSCHRWIVSQRGCKQWPPFAPASSITAASLSVWPEMTTVFS